ncbi:MAG: GNAT family N-acetyltransferase [Clostridiales bacterium]|nr:GNAT family N-acetyltransferase [Clostridiales bacterium]
MLDEKVNQVMVAKSYISKKEFEEIRKLEELCYSVDKTNLKLELNHKLNVSKKTSKDSKHNNEFLCYVEDELVGYLGICSFGGRNIAEINGMVHPKYRRLGIFEKLLEYAVIECNKIKYDKVLLLSDGNSDSGKKFIDSVGGVYDFSEFRMKRNDESTFEQSNVISLRKADNNDGKEIARQNAVYFNHAVIGEYFPEEEELLNKITYMVELKGEVIGKIKISYDKKTSFISGVGILPGYRSKGYGKETLKAALRVINERNIYETMLDVECKNYDALNLYKACGFKEQSVMNYYELHL